MKEIAVVTTAQITDIRIVTDDFDIAECKEKMLKEGGGVLKEFIGCDNAVVTDAQFFIRDVAEGEGADDGKMENEE